MTLHMQTVALAHAHLCLDCECIGPDVKSCPVCGSGALLKLSSILNRSVTGIINAILLEEPPGKIK